MEDSKLDESYIPTAKTLGHIGKKYGRLTVLRIIGRRKKQVLVEAECECGNIKTVSIGHLMSGHTQSCICLSIERTYRHGGAVNGAPTPTYRSWGSMKRSSIVEGYSIDTSWVGEKGFSNFIKDMGERPSLKHILGRYDIEGAYNKTNCVWITRKEYAVGKTIGAPQTLPNEIVMPVLALYKTGLSCKEIANRLVNMSPSRVASILRSRNLPINYEADLTEARILELHKQALNNVEIALKLKCSVHTVVKYLNHNNLSSQYGSKEYKMRGLNKISETEAICSKCGKIKPIAQFITNRRGLKYEYQLTYCNTCRKQQIHLRINNNIISFLSDKYSRVKGNAKRRNIPFAITREYFIQLYFFQEGRCFYTDIEMICVAGKGKSRDSMSFDKIIPSLGYVENNVVFCTHKANTTKGDLTLEEMQQWTPEWYRRIVEFTGISC